MNPGGLVLLTFSAVALCQLFGGDALKRLNILPSGFSLGSVAPGETLLGQAPPGTTLPDLPPGATMPKGKSPDAPHYHPPTITGASAPAPAPGLTLVG